METYFNESVQGLDIGSKMKYRGVVIGEVTRISFTYVKYEQDKPMNQRKRYVLVEAQLEPRLVGGRAANDIASPESSADRGRARLARAARAAGHHRAPTTSSSTTSIRCPRRCCRSTGCRTTSTSRARRRRSTTFVNAATEIIDRLHRLDIETTVANLNRLLVTAQRPRRESRYRGHLAECHCHCTARREDVGQDRLDARTESRARSCPTRR